MEALKIGDEIKITKGMRKAHNALSGGEIEITLRSIWRVVDIAPLDGESFAAGARVRIEPTRGGRARCLFNVSAMAKLQREEITLNTGDPTRTIKCVRNLKPPPRRDPAALEASDRPSEPDAADKTLRDSTERRINALAAAQESISAAMRELRKAPPIHAAAGLDTPMTILARALNSATRELEHLRASIV